MAKRLRFKKRTSDLSGFDGLESEMVKEKGFWINQEERDDPPPSKLSLGGEGEISRGPYFRASTDIFTLESSRENPTYYITAAGGITPSYTFPYMRVTGSNSAINITADPQISAGVQGSVLTLFGTDSSITLENGAGLALMGSIPFVLNSGNSITLIYNSGNTAWNETSRFSGQGMGG